MEIPRNRRQTNGGKIIKLLFLILNWHRGFPQFISPRVLRIPGDLFFCPDLFFCRWLFKSSSDSRLWEAVRARLAPTPTHVRGLATLIRIWFIIFSVSHPPWQIKCHHQLYFWHFLAPQMTGSHIYMKTSRINELLLTPVWHGVNYDWDYELWLVLWDICHFSTFTFWLRSRPLVSRAPMVMRGGWPPGQVRWGADNTRPCSDEIGGMIKICAGGECVQVVGWLFSGFAAKLWNLGNKKK